MAVASGDGNSAVASAAYAMTGSLPAAVTPTFLPAAGAYTSAQSVVLSDSTTGATIYYTTNGTTPTAASTKYAGPITVSSTETLQAIAAATGYATRGRISCLHHCCVPSHCADAGVLSRCRDL